MDLIDPDTLRGLLYARQSRNRDVSIQDQIDEGLDRFQAEGWPEPLVLKDGRGASRHSPGSRDDWPKAVELMETGQRNLLWLWEQSRGDRVASDFLRVLETCRELRVLVYIEEHERLFNPSDDKDWEELAEQAIKDESESNKIARRTNRAKRRARAGGNLRRVVGGHPPIGYRDGKLDWETDPRHADMLREVAAAMLPPFRQTLAGAFAAWTLANGPVHLNLAGGGQGRQVTAKDLGRALRRPALAALMNDAPEKNADRKWVRRGKIIRQVDVAGGPPLDRETWEALQRMFAESSAGRAPAAEYPLGKVLACAYCGNQLSGKIQDGRRKYRCANAHKIRGSNPPRYIRSCGKVMIPADETNEVLRFAVAQWWTEHADEFAPADPGPLDAALADERAKLIARRDHVENQRKVFARKFANDDFTEEFYEELDAGAAGELALVQAALEELAAEQLTAEEEARAAREGRLPPELEHWDELGAQDKQRWVSKAFETPIKVIQAYGSGRKIPSDERLILVPRDWREAR